MSVDENFADAAEAPPDAEAVARELAKLPPLEYGQRRKAEAERLGLPVSILDAAVKECRKAEVSDAPLAEAVEAADPWPSPVGGLAEAERVRRALLMSSFPATPTPTQQRSGSSARS